MGRGSRGDIEVLWENTSGRGEGQGGLVRTGPEGRGGGLADHTCRADRREWFAVAGSERRSTDGVVLPVWLSEDRRRVEVAEGEIVGLGYAPFLDRARTQPLDEDSAGPVLPGVFCTRVSGIAFHDDVAQLPHFSAGSDVEIRPEPANARDRNPLAIVGAGVRIGYVPASIADSLAPSGTRVGRGFILMEWSKNGTRHGLTVLGSMHVRLLVSTEV